MTAARLSAVFLLLHCACFASHVATLIILFTLSWLDSGDLGWLIQAIGLLALQVSISFVCSWTAWKELKSRQFPFNRLCLLPLLPLLGLGQLIQPWLAWKELRAGQGAQSHGQSVHRYAQLHRGRVMQTAPPRFSCSGVEAVAQGAAFAAVALCLLTGALWTPSELDVESRMLLWVCAGLSLLSACLALVEMDISLSDTAAATLSSRPGRAFPLHFGLRAIEVLSRVWVWAVLMSLLSTEPLPIGGLHLLPLLLLVDYLLTALTFLGGQGGQVVWLLALGAMVANLVKFVDSAAWSIRAKKVTRRLAWLRHLETLLAFLGGGIWMAGYWPSSAPRNGPVRSWRELSLFLADGRNSLLLLGAGSVLLYHVMSFSLSQLHAAQVRADGLHRAAARGDAEALSRLVRELEGREVVSCPRPATSYLLAGGINALNSEGWAPVHLAATAGADRALRVLLRSRAEVSAVGAGRATPLMLSAEAGHDKTLRLLLASGALQGISLENSDGNTALHLAVREGHSECIHRLLRARADPSAINAQGVTPFGITRCQKFTESVLNSSQLSTRDAFFEVFNQRSVARTSEVEDPQDACQPLPSSASSRRASPVMTPRRSATGSPTLTVRSCGSVLDVPVVAAEDSALEELFAEATRGGLRLSNANAISSVVTEGTSRSSPTPPNELGGVPVKITGLACLVAVASPGVLRRLVAEPVGPRGSESLQEDNKLSYFRIVGLVGEGSFGSVYEACDMRPSPGGSQVLGDRRCALKILHRRQYLAQDMLARAKRERQVLKAARHPFIVRLLCAFRTPGNEMALVMEYCPNGNLNDLIVRKGRPGLSEAITRKLLAEVLLALAYLHDELDVVFGDVKPDNIVLDTCMHAKLTDFGLAKVNVSRGGGSCGFEGSMFFVAPEVTPAAARYSPAVDIYALGLVAWVCLTGGRPTEVLEGQKSGREQRLPPVSHEALRNWLDERRSKAETRATPRELSDLAFSFVDTTTESEPLKRGRASDLRDHPFFVESDFSPRLHDSGDWAALLPACDWPRSPGSVATQDSWSWSGPRS